MPLNDLTIKRAKPGPKIIKLSDSGGLQLWMTPDGAKRWRLAYRFAGKQRVLAIGVYPKVGLKDAREAREKARRTLSEGADPAQAKRAAKSAAEVATATVFSAIATELIEKKRLEGKSSRTLKKLEWLLDFARPTIGDRPIGEISAREVLDVLNRVAARGRYETALKLREFIGGVFRSAVQTSLAENDPTGALRGALVTPTVKPRSAIVAPKAFGALLRAIEDYQGAPETRAALELLALTFVRPGELRAAEWAEFDLDNVVWEIPAGRMKMRKAHRVPLAPCALAVLTRRIHDDLWVSVPFGAG